MRTLYDDTILCVTRPGEPMSLGHLQVVEDAHQAFIIMQQRVDRAGPWRWGTPLNTWQPAPSICIIWSRPPLSTDPSEPQSGNAQR